ncbi:hypothetical protein ACPA9J_00620 [Pseudomonas aeruginosa]
MGPPRFLGTRTPPCSFAACPSNGRSPCGRLCLLGVVALLVGLFGLPHAAQQRAGEKRQYTRCSTNRRACAWKPAGLQALRIQRYFMDAFQYGKGFSRQILFLRDQAQKRFLDAYDLREDLTRQVRTALAANPGGARPVRGLRTQCAGRQGRTVRRPARPGQQRQGDASPVLGAGHAGTAGIRVDDRVRTRRHQKKAQRRGLQRLVHLPEGKRATLRASILTSTRSANANC